MFHRWGASPLPTLEMLDPTDLDFEAVSTDGSFGRTQMVAEARSLLRAMTTDSGRARLGPAATVVHLVAGSCESDAYEEAAQRSVQTLATQSLPFLSKQDAASLLSVELPEACRERVSAKVRDWHALYAAVAARDPEQMAVLGAKALDDATLDEDRQRYALTAAMLGTFARGEPASTLQLWDGRSAALQAVPSTPDLELIVAVARKRVADDLDAAQHR